MQALAAIRVLAFDLDNTLWDVEPVIARAELRLLEWLRSHWPLIPERFSLEQMRAARYEVAREHPDRAHDFTFVRIEAMSRHVRACGYDLAIAQQAFEVFFAARNEVQTFADVQPALARLATRYMLATLSNGNADLARIGLAEHFALSLNACGIGSAKPDRRCFEALAAGLQVEAHQIAYVGDDPYLDVDGARRAGLPAVWMNRTGAVWPQGLAPPLLEVCDCSALVDVLLGAGLEPRRHPIRSSGQFPAAGLDDE